MLKDQSAHIHHIGSTAVPGLRAKPVIDILLETQDLDSLVAFDPEMEHLGYIPKGEFGISGRRFYLGYAIKNPRIFEKSFCSFIRIFVCHRWKYERWREINYFTTYLKKLCPKLVKNIEIYRKPSVLKNQRLPEVTPHIFRFFVFFCLLHTVEVIGSNPVSPTDLYEDAINSPPLIGQGGWGVNKYN